MEGHHEEDRETVKVGAVLHHIKRAGSFFNKYKFLLLILIPILLTWTIRDYHNSMPVADDWARNNFYDFLRSQVSTQVNSQYPSLPEANKNSLIEKQFNQLRIDRHDEIETQIKSSADYLRNYFKDENGYTYLSDIDSYYYYRKAMNIIRYGHDGNVLINRVSYDTFIGAPHTSKTAPIFHSTFSAYFYKVLRIFDPKITVMHAFSYVPTFFAILTAIIAYLIGRRIAGDLAGLFISILISVNPTFISRSIGGDTDIYNVFFPILLTWIFIEMLSAKSWKGKIIYSSSLGIAMGVFSFAWQSGWTFMFDIFIATIFLYYIIKVLINRNHLKHGFYKFLVEPYKKLFISTGIFIISSALFVGIFNGFFTIFNAFTSIFDFIKLKQVATVTLWPNINTTIAELNPGSVSDMVGSFGGWLLFLLASIGVILAIFRKEKIKTLESVVIVCSIIYYYILIKFFQNTAVLTFSILMSLPILAAFLVIIKTRDNESNFINGLLLSLWFIITIASINQGVRFLLLILSPFAIAFAFTIDFIFRLAVHFSTAYSTKGKHVFMVFLVNTALLLIIPFQKFYPDIISNVIPVISLKIILIVFEVLLVLFMIFSLVKKQSKSLIIASKIIIVMFILILLMRPVDSGNGSTRGVFPMMNDVWYNALNEIKEKSDKDAIINSWWDYGHWFKSIGDRRTTFDGGYQVGYGAYWIGKSLLTSNEHETWGILRMLDCGANGAYTELNAYINNDPKSIDILNSIIILEKTDATILLKEKGIPDDVAKRVLNLSHCTPPENYYIASEDMIGKSGVWAHFGSWNFNKSEMYNRVSNLDYNAGIKILTEDYKLDSNTAEKYYKEIKSTPADRWISPWPSYASGVYRCGESLGKVSCENGIEFDINTKEVTFNSPQGKMQPYSFVYADEGKVKEIKYDNPSVPYSFSLFQRGGQWESIIMMPELATSMFTKLFFFEGLGLNHFDSFFHEKGLTGTDVYVYKVNWAGKDNSKAGEFETTTNNSDIKVTVT